MITYEIANLEDLKKSISNKDALVIYFSTPHCNVCKILKPKLIEFIRSDFPLIDFAYIDLEKIKEASGEYQVFTTPTVIIYFGGKEFLRKSRNFSMVELNLAIKRPYSMLFS